jgi:hypothetical protein
MPFKEHPMMPLPFSLFADMASLALEANMVVGLRMMRLATGGEGAAREAHLMVAEKLQMAGTLAVENAMALASGKSMHAVGKSSIAKYRKAVLSNHKRLSK